MRDRNRIGVFGLIIACLIIAGCTGMTHNQFETSLYSDDTGGGGSYFADDKIFDENWD